ncbi:MAG: ATP-binding cassette domain-containing protein [Roseiflexaceae bacterium]
MNSTPPTSTLMIAAHGLTKQYGVAPKTVQALRGLDLQVQQGAIYALLGPNGAGKTTAISILTTLSQPTSGHATVAGFDIVREAHAVRARIGATFQDLVLDQDLTGRQVLDIHGRLYRQPTDLRRRRIHDLVEMVKLNDAIDRLVKTYSGGMKRRLELARGLMTDPQVLFLDEPTQGLDPQNRASIWEYIRFLQREQGLTLLLTTHAMEEADALANTVGIIDHGAMVVEGTPSQLIATLGADLIRVTGHGPAEPLLTTLQERPFVQAIEHFPDQQLLELRVDHGSQRIAEVVALLASAAWHIADVAVARPSLGDVFLKYTGRALRD